MMTIHKSKGLEFETVILPGLHRVTGGNDSSLLLWDEVAGADGEEHLLVAPMKAKGAGNDQPTTYDYLKNSKANAGRTKTSVCSMWLRRGPSVACIWWVWRWLMTIRMTA